MRALDKQAKELDASADDVIQNLINAQIAGNGVRDVKKGHLFASWFKRWFIRFEISSRAMIEHAERKPRRPVHRRSPTGIAGRAD
jgi:hypothetical protein